MTLDQIKVSISEYLAAGSIPKVRHTELKERLNRNIVRYLKENEK